jgi:hypothetical protein
MKKTACYYSSKIKLNLILLNCVLLLSLFFNKIFAQSPNVEWKNFTWIDREYKSSSYVDQRHSDYDWWYDHCTGYTNPLTKTGHHKVSISNTKIINIK